MKAMPSFFGYAAVVADVLLRLHTKDPKGDHKLLADQECKVCLDFLQRCSDCGTNN
jgi:hypothetical protein